MSLLSRISAAAFTLAVLSPAHAQTVEFGNVQVVQNDSGNTAASVTLGKGAGSSPNFSPLSGNRGDYDVSFGTLNDAANGVMITAVSQNGRDNSASGDTIGLFYGSSATDWVGSANPGKYWVPVFRTANGDEVNINVSCVWFNYSHWLGGFARITVLEPDPLARWLLRRRPDATRLHFDDLDCLATPDGLAHLKARFPDAAILFCNVLGQVTAPGGRGWAELCACHLHDLPWASLHDVVSTPRAPRADAVRASFPGGTSLEAVLAAFWPGGELPLVDHATFALGGDVPHHYALWPLRPGRWHLVEWVAHAMQNDTSAMPDDAAGRGRAV